VNKTAASIVDKESLKKWLEEQPIEISPSIAQRAALRVFSNVLSIHKFSDEEFDREMQFILTAKTFRANFIPWAARKYPAHDMKTAIRSIASITVVFSTAFSTTDHAALSALDSVNSAINSTVDSAVSAAALSAALSATAFSQAAAHSAIWNTVQADAVAIEMGHNLINLPLWFELHDSTVNWRPTTPQWAIDNITTARELPEFSTNGENGKFGLILDWYNALLEDPPRSLFGETKDIELATQKEEFWEGNAFEVMERVAELVGWPKASAKIQSPFDYGWTAEGKITMIGGAMENLISPSNRSPQDAARRLEAARVLAENLTTDLSRNTLQARTSYQSALARYVENLPRDHDGSIYLADAAMRELRDDLEDDIKQGMDNRAARRLKSVLEQHYGLRPYFPDLMTFYDDVREGKLTEPPPLEAMAKIEEIIVENTPDVFEPNVSQSLGSLDHVRPERPPAGGLKDEAPIESDITLPPDPIANIDPERAGQHAKAGAINKIIDTFKTVEKGHKAIERVTKVGKALYKAGEIIREWLF